MKRREVHTDSSLQVRDSFLGVLFVYDEWQPVVEILFPWRSFTKINKWDEKRGEKQTD